MAEKSTDWFGVIGGLSFCSIVLIAALYVGGVVVCWLGGYGPWSAERYRLEAELREKENTKKMRAIEYIIHDGKRVNEAYADAEKP